VRRSFIVFILLAQAATLFAQDAPVILNEYNAVAKDGYLDSGDALKDKDGGAAADARFGRVKGNGGNWFELVVTRDRLDMRRWTLEYSWLDEKKNARQKKALRLSDHPLWSDLRAGTIVTVAEDVPEDASYDPARGDWTINVRAHKKLGSGKYIERAGFRVSANDWQLTIKDASGVVRFGPTGEGVYPKRGVRSWETFRLETDPSSAVTADSMYYKDGDDFSTFGAPNRWKQGLQDFGALRK
jgi:hypothetical protein